MSSLLSIDLGTRNLHLAEGSFQKNILNVDRVGVFTLPDDCMKGDMIINIQAVANTLIRAIQTFGSKSKDAVITINAVSALVRDVDFPPAKSKQLESMMQHELAQAYNVTDNHETQHKVIEKIQSADGSPLIRYRRLSLEIPLVESCHQLLQKAKKKPVAMDVNINAIDKLLGITNQINDKPLGAAGTMLVDFGHHSTTIYIYSKDKPLFYRHVSTGSEEIEKIISEETLSSPEDLRNLKESDFNLFGEEEKEKTYFQYLRPYFYSLNDEISKIISFYSDRNEGIPVEQIYLFGGGSKLAGLSGYWETNFNIPMEIIQSMSSVQLPKDKGDISLCLNSIGAMIRY